MVLEKYGRKKIHGRMVDLIVIDKLKKPIKKYGKGGCHITIPIMHKEKQSEVKIISPMPFICDGCIETVSNEKHFSPDPELCDLCFRDKLKFEEWKKKPEKEKICRICKKYLSDEEFKGFWCNGEHIECSQDKLDKEMEEDN